MLKKRNFKQFNMIKKIVIFCLCIPLFLPADEQTFCKSNLVNTVTKEIESEMILFANQPSIAIKADDILSKLIKAQSPFFFSWLEANKLDPIKDTENIVKVWRVYFSQNYLINKYPLKDNVIDLEIEKFFIKLNTLYFTEDNREKFNKHFLATKKMAILTLESFNLEQNTKKEIIKNLNQIKLYFPKNLKDSKFKNHALDYFEWGIAYDPIEKEINLGLNAFLYPFDETLEAVFAHEFAHLFDSCRWGAFFKGEWPFTKVGNCLRQFAKTRDDSKLDKLPADLALALKMNPTCNKINYPANGLQADQLPETFADWFSAEVMANSFKDNTRNDLCFEKVLHSGSSYLSNKDRLFKIYFANPRISKLIKAKATAEYCPFL